MKKLLGRLFNFTLFRYLDLRLYYYKKKNKKELKLFIYTDSRGHEITKKRNKNNPFSSHVSYFIKKYCCEVHLNPEKPSTIIDFLETYNNSSKDFDFVIAHIGVVDFASRFHSQAIDIIKERKEKYLNFITQEEYDDLVQFEGYSTLFEGKKTSAITPDFMIDSLVTEINKIPSLIWISCNDIDLKWRGNYKRDRPLNSDIILSKSKYLIDKLETKKIINLTNFKQKEIHSFTCDNVHFSEKGMDMLEKELKLIIE